MTSYEALWDNVEILRIFLKKRFQEIEHYHILNIDRTSKFVKKLWRSFRDSLLEVSKLLNIPGKREMF